MCLQTIGHYLSFVKSGGYVSAGCCLAKRSCFSVAGLAAVVLGIDQAAGSEVDIMFKLNPCKRSFESPTLVNVLTSVKFFLGSQKPCAEYETEKAAREFFDLEIPVLAGAIAVSLLVGGVFAFMERKTRPEASLSVAELNTEIGRLTPITTLQRQKLEAFKKLHAAFDPINQAVAVAEINTALTTIQALA